MRAGWGLGVAALALGTGSCAYYNTYYLAKRYYNTATAGLPYPVEKPTGAQTGNYQKSIDYSKKVIANYPKSKWVDDAYLMWAQGLLGKDDPLQSVNMLQDFHRRYPDSPLVNQATFYLGVAYRQARKPREALVAFDFFIEKAPKHELIPYAHLERSRVLTALERPADAAAAATQVIERYPRSPLAARARAERAEALLAGGDPVAARQDFQELGLRAVDDAARFGFLLREADCLEAARDYTNALILLQGALAHEPAPIKSATGAAPTGPGTERYGQLTLRIGTIHLQAGNADQALAAYRNVLQDYPKTALAAEAQYRIAYTHETALDDFTTARQEYAKVRDQSVSSTFFGQAMQRQQSLDRLERFRSSGADSVDKKVEAGFLLAEQYLFQLDKPDRAVEAYAAIAKDYPGTPAAAKAMNAEAWVLRRRLDRGAEADSLLWRVVREHPATEAQLAARDYLEAAGHTVPPELIQAPEEPEPPPDTTVALTTPPIGPMPLGPHGRTDPSLGPATTDSLGAARGVMIGPALPGTIGLTDTTAARAASPSATADSIARAAAMAPKPAGFDSVARSQTTGGGKPAVGAAVGGGAAAGLQTGGGAAGQTGGAVAPQSGAGPSAQSGSGPAAGSGPAVSAGGGAAAGAAAGAGALTGAAGAAGTQAGVNPQSGPGAPSGASAGTGAAGVNPQAGPVAPSGASAATDVAGTGPRPGAGAAAGSAAVAARPDTTQRAPVDTTLRAPADTTLRAPVDTTLRARPPRPAAPARPDTIWAPR